MSKNDTQFEWLATESAPQHYPMKVIQGTFIYRGENHGLYVPSGGTLRGGWGEAVSNHHDGEKFKPLPDRLKIIFFSNAENQFYSGEFDLPYEKILALFRDGVENPIDLGKGKTFPVYDRMMVGIAPGGAVAVWVKGKECREVFFGQAQKIELDPSRAFALPFRDKPDADAYIAKQLVNSLRPEELESLKKDGIPFGLWARYRNLYDWRLTTSAGHSFSNKPTVAYLNGESLGEWIFADTNAPLRPVPSYVSFRSADKTLYTVTLEEFETLAAFEKLGANGKKVYLEFEPRLPRTQLKIRLYNDKESIVLKKFVSDDW